MAVFALPQVASYLTGLKTAVVPPGGASPLPDFLGRARGLLADQKDPQTADLEGILASAATTDDRAVREGAIDRITGDDRFLTQIAPVVVNAVLREGGDHTLPPLVDRSHYPGFQPGDLQRALEGLGDAKRVAILAAAERQSVVWGRLSGTDFVPMEMGALAHSGGDFDAVMICLMAQGLSYRWAQAPAPEGDPLLVTVLSRGGKPGEPPNVYALQYGAGQHKRLSLHQLPKPFVPTAFPPEAREGVIGKFDLHFMTPTAARIEETLTPAVVAQLRQGAMMVYDPKSFSPSGKTMDEWAGQVLAEAGRGDVATAFVAGFTGAKTVYGEPSKLPTLPEEGMHGLLLGIGVSDLNRGLQLASVLTGMPVAQATVATVGAAKVYTFKELSFPRPVVVSVYSDPDLRRVQTLFAIYKNIFSGLNGRDLFNWIWRRLNESHGEVTPDLIRQAEAYYQGLVRQSLREMKKILVHVEGIPKEKVHILPPSERDAIESWQVRDMGLLFNLIRNLFFGSSAGGVVNPAWRDHAVREWRERMGKGEVFATRNLAAGASIAAGEDACRLFLVKDRDDLMPVGERGERLTFEGLNTALNLGERLPTDRMRRLPPRVQGYIVEARQTRHPQVLPPPVRLGIAHLASLLAKRAAGQIPTVEEAEALLDGEVRQEDLEDTVRWRGTLTVGDFVKAVNALRRHLENGIDLIREYGDQHAALAQPMLRQLGAMVAHMGQMIEEVQRVNDRSPLQVHQLRMLLHALKALITEGDRIYLGEELRDVMRDLRDRMLLMFAYLRNEVPAPYPQGYHHFLPTHYRRGGVEQTP